MVVDLRIAMNIAVEFRLPEVFTSFWDAGFRAVWVPVPKAPMHEERDTMFGESEIWLAGKVLRMKAEAEA